MKKKTENKIDEVTRMLVLLMLFAAPVVFCTHWVYDGFGIPKVTLLRIFAPLIFALWAGEKFFSKEEIRVTGISAAAGLFVFALAAATLFSKNFAVSFYGLCPYYEWGFINVFAGFMIFVVITDKFDSRDLPLLAQTIFAAVLVVGIYGLMQAMGFDPFYKSEVSFGRIFSTMGNPNFLAGWLVAVFPVVLAGYFYPIGHRSRAGWDKNLLPYRAQAAALIVLIIINLGLTLSRAGFLAAGAGMLSFVFFSGRAFLKVRKNQMIFITLLSIIAVLFFVSGRRGFAGYETGESLLSERVKVTLDSSESSAAARIETWKSAAVMFKDNFITGAGPNMFQYLFPKYETLKCARILGGKTISNYAHNTLLHSAATTGITGLLTYIFLWFCLFRYGMKALLVSDVKSRYYLPGFLAGLAALFVFLQFHFFLNETMLYFWAFAGIISSLSAGKNLSLKRAAKLLIFVFALTAVVFYWTFALRHFSADSSFSGGKPAEAYRILPQSAVYSLPALIDCRNRASAERNIELLYRARDIARKNVARHPYNPQFWNNLGAVDMDFLQFGSEEFIEEAEYAFKKAYEVGPFLVKHIMDLSKYYEIGGDVESAEKYMKKAEAVRGKK